MKNRIDKELLKRNMVPSRSKSQELINSSLVLCNGKVVNKCNFLVDENDNITIIENDKLKYVSRAGLKLEKALKKFNINVTGLNAMDIGSSTGGFCDCLLQNGINHIVAVDVGTNLLDKSLRNNSKIELHEQTNFKDLDNIYFKNIDIMTCDVSFISLTKIIEKIFNEKVKVDMICLIKPQFECGEEIARKYKGIILDKKVHYEIINRMINDMNSYGFYIKNITYSPIRGGDGNIEYLCYINNKVKNNIKIDINKLINEAFKSR